jgi:beta-lactamase class A
MMFSNELSRFSTTNTLLSTDITVAGVPVGGKTLTDAVKAWETIYAQPVQLDYGDSPILLYPSQIAFVVKSDLMRGQVQSRSAGSSNYWQDFLNYLWRRSSTPLDVPLSAEYQKPKLIELMQDVALRYEQRAGSAYFDLNTMTFSSGTNGRRIDIEAALPLIDSALRRPTNRRVTLPLKAEGARDKSMSTLKAAIEDYLSNFNYLGSRGLSFDGPATAGSVVVIDLKTGEELSINPRVAFSAVSTIKIPILINHFRFLTLAAPTDNKWLMAASILCSSNSASNFLMQLTGGGQTANAQLRNGLQNVQGTLQGIGAKNSYINAPMYVVDKEYQFSIPAPKTNPDKTIDTKADPFNQITAEDMAVALQAIYDCAKFNTGLLSIYPDNFTQTECQQMLELMRGNTIGRLLELGTPQGTPIAHKNGWGGTQKSGANVGDAGIVFSPNGDYLIVVYIWEYRANQDGIGSLDAWKALEGISRITYNYFNSDKPLTVARTPENQFGAIDCVMPNPNFADRVDLDNINNGRFNPDGSLVADACVNYPACKP